MKNWKHFVILGLAIIVIILLWLDSPKPIQQPIDINKVKKEVIDSIEHEQNKVIIAKLDSTRKEYNAKLAKSEANVLMLKDKLKNQKTIYKSDTIAQSAPCDSVIKTSEVIIDSLDYQVSILAAIRENMALKIDAIETDSKIIESNLLASYMENDRLKKDIKEYTNWWSRNNKWFYLAGGVIITALVLK